MLLAGCARVESVHYPEATWKLDDRKVVSISTYAVAHRPAGADIPYLYESARSVESVYFKVVVADAASEAGSGPPDPSIVIRSLTYRLAGAPPVTLVAAFRSNFWMQDNPHHTANHPGAATPVPCVPGQSVTVRAEISVDDQDHAVDAVLTCESRVSFYPLVLQSA